MDELYLARPDITYKEEILHYQEDFFKEKDSFDGTSRLCDYTSIEEWLVQVKANEKEESCETGWIPCLQYLCLRKKDQHLVGMGDLRLKMNEKCLLYYGGLGYSILPKERGKGYGSELLRLLLAKAKEYGMKEVLVCCYEDNEASKRVIWKNGGVFESKILEPRDTKWTERYWISLKREEIHPLKNSGT